MWAAVTWSGERPETVTAKVRRLVTSSKVRRAKPEPGPTTAGTACRPLRPTSIWVTAASAVLDSGTRAEDAKARAARANPRNGRNLFIYPPWGLKEIATALTRLKPRVKEAPHYAPNKAQIFIRAIGIANK